MLTSHVRCVQHSREISGNWRRPGSEKAATDRYKYQTRRAKNTRTNFDTAEVVCCSKQAAALRPVAASNMNRIQIARHAAPCNCVDVGAVGSCSASQQKCGIKRKQQNSPSGHMPLTGHPSTVVNVDHCVPAISTVFLFCSQDGMIQYSSSFAWQVLCSSVPSLISG